MKVFATSDLHGNLDRLDPKDCDLIFIAGMSRRLTDSVRKTSGVRSRG